MENEDERLKRVIAQIIMDLREKEAMSRNELARRIDFNPNSLYFIEKGGNRSKNGQIEFVQHLPSLPTLMRIASVFNMTPTGLIDRIMNDLGDGMKEYDCSKIGRKRKETPVLGELERLLGAQIPDEAIDDVTENIKNDTTEGD